jgi:exonuclease SbcD
MHLFALRQRRCGAWRATRATTREGIVKLLHTADLHLGRQFFGISLADDHAAVLEQIRAAMETHRPDALIIAGDVFDRAAPPETAVRQFNAFIRAVADDTEAAIILIAGNHDSGERIEAMAMLADDTRTLVRGAVRNSEPPLVLEDANGPVAFSALPFSYEFAARACFENDDIKTPADVLAAQVDAARAEVPPGARWVVIAHAFVDGAAGTDSERPLTRALGGIETVPASVFAGADYVALGHLHRPQAVGADHIRYSGAPLAFGFDEEGQRKSMTLVELGPDGGVTTEEIPFAPPRRVRTLTGTLDELLGEAHAPSEDFIQVMLTDTHRRIDPMKRLRERFPNACALRYAALHEARASDGGRTVTADVEPIELVGAFLETTRETTLTNSERALIETELAKLGAGGDTDEDAAA